MALATLSIDLIARLASLEQGFDKAGRLAEKSAAEMQRRFDRVGASLQSVARLAATAFAGVSVVSFVRSTVDGIDALNDLKDVTGASIENLSALEDVAIRTGATFETVSTTLTAFQKALKEATPGSENERAFANLGLRVDELRKADPAEALRQTARAFAGFADGPQKAEYFLQLFKKSASEVAPFLNDLAKQTQLVGKVTTEQAEAAERFNQQLADLKKNALDAGRSLVLDMLPGLSKVLREFTAGKEAFGGFFSALGNLGTSRAFDNQLEGLEHYRRELLRAQQAQEAIANGEDGNRFSIFGQDRLEAAKKNVEEVRRFVTYYEKLLGLQNRAGAGRGSVNPDPLKLAPLDTPDKGKDKASETQRFIEALQQQTLAALDLTKVEEVQLLLAGKLATATAKEREEILALAAGLDALKAKTPTEDPRTAFRRSELNAQPKDSEALQFFGKQIEDANRDLDELSGRIEQERKRILTARLEARLAAGEVFSPEELDRIVKGIAGIGAAAEEAKGVAEELGLTFSSAFENALVEGEKLSSVLQSLEKDILRIITRKLVTEPLADKATSIIKGLGGSGSGGFDLGALFSSLFSGFFASGGFIPPGRWGMTGERGPEPVFGGRTGVTVQPAGGQQIVLNQSINAGGAVDRRSAQQIAAEAAFAIARAQRNL